MGWPADVPASAHVFVASAAELGEAVEIGGEEGHHLARVLRLRTGETVTVADGAGRWRPYRVGNVSAPGGGPALVRLDAAGGPEQEPAASFRLAVAFALTKGDKPDLVVQKLPELAADRILPVLDERSVRRPDPGPGAAALEPRRRTCRAATRQSRRPPIP